MTRPISLGQFCHYSGFVNETTMTSSRRDASRRSVWSRIAAARVGGTAAAILILVGQAQATGVSTLGAATGYNAFIFSNFTSYGTDSEGKVAVGGNFAPSSGGFTVASTHSADKAGAYDLVVGGNYTNTYVSVGGGDIFVGGNMNWNTPTLPNNAYVNGNVTNTGWGSVGGSIYYAGSYSSVGTLNATKVKTPTAAPIDFLGAQTSLQNLSSTLASQTANTTINVAYNTYTMTGNDKTLNVFNLADSSFNGSTINISAPSGSTVVVNVAGKADSFNGGSINYSGVTAANVIFNFNSAQTLALAAIAFNGTILAPYATVNGNYGQLNGQLIANNLAGTTELHDVLFSGTLPGGSTTTTTTSSQTAATPEPSTWLLVLGSVLFSLGTMRKERVAVLARAFVRRSR